MVRNDVCHNVTNAVTSTVRNGVQTRPDQTRVFIRLSRGCPLVKSSSFVAVGRRARQPKAMRMPCPMKVWA
jgi:hypothetical protein